MNSPSSRTRPGMSGHESAGTRCTPNGGSALLCSSHDIFDTLGEIVSPSLIALHDDPRGMAEVIAIASRDGRTCCSGQIGNIDAADELTKGCLPCDRGNVPLKLRLELLLHPQSVLGIAAIAQVVSSPGSPWAKFGLRSQGLPGLRSRTHFEQRRSATSNINDSAAST